MSRIVESLYDRYIINESYKLITGKTYRIKDNHNRLAEFEYVGHDENGYKFKPLNAMAKKFAKDSVEADSEYLGHDGFFEYDGFLYLDDYGLEVYFDKYDLSK